LWALVVAAATVVLTACGGGEPLPPQNSTPPALAAQAPSAAVAAADALPAEQRMAAPGPRFPDSMAGLAADPSSRKALGQAPSASDGGYVVDTGNRESVRLFYKSVYASSNDVPSGWNGSLAGCNAGETTAEFKAATLRRINWFRAMAGVPAAVQFDAGFNAKAQQAALLMSANGQLSHNPPPAWTCYNPTAAEAAGKSNLALGRSGADAMARGYMQDPGAGNAAGGHRRWILYPQTRFMGSGDVGGGASPTDTTVVNALWVQDADIRSARPPVRDDFVAWPAKGYTPYPAVYPRWSFSYPDADFSAATVAMTENGVPIATRLEAVQNGFGENTLVWIPGAYTDSMAWARPAADTVYQVTVGNVTVGGRSRAFTYSATVFDPEQPAADAASATIDGDSRIASGQTGAYTFGAAAGATSYQWRSVVLSPFALNDGAETGTGSFSVSSSPGYPVTTTDAAATGASSFHLAHTQPVDQTLQLLGAFVGSPSASVSFQSRLGLASANQIARVEVSRDDGKSWVSVFEQAGQQSGVTSSFGEAGFSNKQVSLAQYADKTIQLRFRYERPAGSYYPQASSGIGWYIDDVRLDGVDAVVAAGAATAIATNSFGFSTGQTGTVLLEVQAGMYGRYSDWNLSKRIVVSEPLLAGNQTFSNTTANDAFGGGAGIDTVLFNGSRASYTLARTTPGWSIQSATGGSDTIQNIERLRFADKKLALDLGPTERAGQALQFVGLLAPSLINAPAVVGTVLAVFDQGKSLLEVCQIALDIGLVESIAGARSNAAIAAMAYRNVVGFEPDATAIDMLVAYMDGRSARYSQAAFMAIVAALEANQARIGLARLQQTGVEFE
jgi:uncharacterized protein YkwD